MGILDKLLAKLKGDSSDSEMSTGDAGGVSAPEAAASEPMPSAAASTAGSGYGAPGESGMGEPETPDDRPGGPV